MEKTKQNIGVTTGKTRMGMEDIKQSAESLFSVVQRLDQGISAALDKGKDAAAVASSVQSAVRKMKKALAGFDELQILQMPKSSSGGSGKSSSKSEDTGVSVYLEIIQELLEMYGDAAKDIQNLDMGEEGLLGYLWDALWGEGNDAPTVQLPSEMERALDVLANTADDTKGPVDAVTAAMLGLDQACGSAKTPVDSVTLAAKSLGQTCGSAKTPVDSVTLAAKSLGQTCGSAKTPVDSVTLAALGLDQACGSVSNAMSQWKGKTTEATTATQNMQGPVNAAKQSLNGLGNESETLSSKLESIGQTSDAAALDVKTGWSGVSDWFKNNVGNKIIGGANGMLSGIVSGVNAVLERLRNLNLTIPDWIPFFGGNTISFGSNSLSFPGIPYLASGAVLPANRPFLAVVGDQKNGTNVEAPLATIKQAVAEVVGDQGGGDITIRFDGDLAQLARVLQPVIYRENRRLGADLVRREVL